MDQIINIVIADDHEIFRDGFRILIKKIPYIQLIGEAANGQELLRIVDELQPDIVITDIKMPVMDGIEATRRLLAKYPGLGIIAFTMFDEENLIVDMLEAGARGYLIKNAPKAEILMAVRTVFEDKKYYCQTTSEKLARLIANSDYDPDKKTERPVFSPKEIAIMRLICKEYSNKEIADQLLIGKRTVEGHREKILEKLNAKNSAGIVVYAIRNKIFQYGE